jgi:3-phenylpropionate/cinnamic acid dioxygenase small subunit
MSDTADRAAIEEILVRYCTIVDARDFQRFDEIFTPDAIIDYTASGGIKGALPEIKTWLIKVLAPFTVVLHHVTNFDIRVEGDRARSTCYLFNPMGLGQPDGTTSMFWCGGRYRDELVRTKGGWRITSRTNEMLYMHGAPRARSET